MGEEKPEEELMGKRKSSPRLSATLSCRYLYDARSWKYLYMHKIGTLQFFIYFFEMSDRMRVISGEYRGQRLIAVPGKNTRPTTDKVKESLFSMIGPYFTGGVCLDLYAGTGALGIEALSRGMEKGIFIDIDRKAIDTINTNIDALKLNTKVEIYKNDAQKAIQALAKRTITFDLVFIDPPYAKEKNETIIYKLVDAGLLNHDAIIVVEHDRTHVLALTSQKLLKWKENVFGDTALTIYKFIQTDY